MIRIARLTDYGIALMTHIARFAEQGPFTARDLATELGLPRPTVSKLLKQLVKKELLVSRRGVYGGYDLDAPPETITLARLIVALEGPIAMTECSVRNAESSCDFEPVCNMRGSWQWINRSIIDTLESITLADMSAARGQSLAELSKAMQDKKLPAEKR